LHSIISSISVYEESIQVCVSDNCSSDDTENIVRRAQEKITIKYQKNSSNLGIPRNFLKVVEMAEGEFVWMIGDDDLLLPCAIKELLNIIDENKGVDFFYINAFHLSTKIVFSYSQPFDTVNLPTIMESFSTYKHGGAMKFMDLINPKVSFDFLGGMFLSVFRRKNWNLNADVLDQKAITDLRTFSHFDNTFPHVKIFSKAFANSKAFFVPKPLSVCLYGAREWAPMQPLVMSVRLVEALENYRRNGLPYFNYLYCKNYALNNFIPDLGSMLFYRNTGLEYINPLRLVIYNCLFPNFYLSLFYFFIRKTKLLFKQIISKF